MRKFFAAVAVLVALTAAGSAMGATIQDLQAAGYAVSVANPGPDGQNCPTYYVSGFGNSSYANLCDPAGQQLVDGWANPETVFEDGWQFNHPDQVAAAQAIGNLCYSITRAAPMTDSWLVVGGVTNTSTPGAGLPQLASSLPSMCGQPGPAPVVAVVQNTDGTGAITAPGAASVVAPVLAQAAGIPASDPPVVTASPAALAAAPLASAPVVSTTLTTTATPAGAATITVNVAIPVRVTGSVVLSPAVHPKTLSHGFHRLTSISVRKPK